MGLFNILFGINQSNSSNDSDQQPNYDEDIYEPEEDDSYYEDDDANEEE